VLLVLARKWIKGKFHGHVSSMQNLEENLDEFTGKKAVVLKDVIPGKMGGVVEFKGARWNAVSHEEVREGEIAIIKGVDGITLKVQKDKEE
jgi:membrane protein implicated in regulation of membrane protease activity